jgi:deoxyadenosine/deoxycytidine kinase
VQRRGIDFEQAITPEYLARLADAYTRFFYQYAEAPLLIVNSERLNFVDDSAHFDLLLERIGHMRSQREFFNLGPA